MDLKDVKAADAPSASAQTQDVKTEASVSSTPATDVSTAPSEPTKGDDRSELLKVVQDALKPKEPEAETPKDPEATGEPAPAKPDEKPDAANQTVQDKSKDKLPDLTEDEIKGYDRRSQKRIRQLVDEKKELLAKLSQVEPTAAVGQEFSSFVEQNKLSKDDTNLLLNIGAALRRGDFETFLKGVMPYVEVAQEAVGTKLPKDLQAKVDEGLIDENMARDYARLRSREQLQTNRLEESDQERQRRDLDAVVVSIKSSVSAWEANVRQTDPDYAAKQGTVLRFSQALAAERGAPRNADEAVKLAKDAYEEVNKLYGEVRPAVQPTRPSPSTSSQVATTASPEPRNLMEAAMLGLRRAAS